MEIRDNDTNMTANNTAGGAGLRITRVRPEKSVNILEEIFDWIESFVFASFMVLLVFIFMFRTVVVDGGSMNPTLYNSQRLILTHFNYTPERGDIIVANSRGLNKTIIKRCIGVGGDKVVVNYSDRTVTVNGEKIDEPYLDPDQPMKQKEYFDSKYLVGDMTYEYIVPEGTVFAMGDNRNGSNDSRSDDVGFIDMSDILGKAVFRFYLGRDDNGSKLPGKIGFLN